MSTCHLLKYNWSGATWYNPTCEAKKWPQNKYSWLLEAVLISTLWEKMTRSNWKQTIKNKKSSKVKVYRLQETRSPEPDPTHGCLSTLLLTHMLQALYDQTPTSVKT